MMLRYVLLTGVMSIGLALPAFAQAPGALPESLDSAPSDLSLPAMTETPNDANLMTDGDVITDPCPEPKKALAKTPDDLAKIQEDITRFTLCVQRAQLLERLNELAEDNIETIDSALNLAASNDDNAMPGIIPDMPEMPSMPTVEEMNPFTQPTQTEPISDPIVAPQGEWKIRNITGNKGQLKAQLVDSQGNYETVMQGESFGDGYKVKSLSRTTIRVTVDGQTETLGWHQENNEGE